LLAKLPSLPAPDKALEQKQLDSLPMKEPKLLFQTLMEVGSCQIVCKKQRLMLYIRLEKAKDVASKINQDGGSALAVAGDMLDDAYIKTLVEKAAEFGNGKIHIIVNNAGYTWDGVIHKVIQP
jgi:hypothetical protein